jgi:hypothetical protein
MIYKWLLKESLVVFKEKALSVLKKKELLLFISQVMRLFRGIWKVLIHC